MPEVRGGLDELPRDDAITHDTLIAIHIEQEGVQRTQALPEPLLYVAPFAVGNDAREEVDWEDAFGLVRIPVDREGDPLV